MNRDDERVDDAMLQRCEPGEAQARRHGSGPKPKGSRGKKNGKPPRPELATTTRKIRGADKPESRTHRTLGSPRTREIFRHTTRGCDAQARCEPCATRWPHMGICALRARARADCDLATSGGDPGGGLRSAAG